MTVAEVRARTAAALAALTGWRESPRHPDTFPGDAGQWAHLAFAVGIPATVYESAQESSRTRRGSVGGLVRSDVRVRWTHRVRADAAVDDYAAALAAEAQAVAALTGLAQTSGLHVAIDQTTRTGAGDGAWLLCEIDCTMTHQAPIQ